MKIIPAIDLQDGKCVRLYQGRFDRRTEYSDDPGSVAREFANLDVDDLHVVDLDGARTGTQANVAAIRAICETTRLSVQLGGGLRDPDDLERWFDAGVARCVVGSVAVESPQRVLDWLRRFGEQRIVLALDVVVDDGTPLLATRGWTETTQTTLWQCLDDYAEHGAQHVLCTDIRRDGAMAGPNVDLYRRITKRYPALLVQASGGVRSAADLAALADAGAAAAVTGRALLDGKLTKREVAAFRQSA